MAVEWEVIPKQALKVVRELASTTGERAYLLAGQGDFVTCLAADTGNLSLRSDVLHVGVRFPLGISAGGVALLATHDDHFIDGLLERARLATDWGPLHSDTLIRQRVQETRKRGFSINGGLLLQGNLGLSAAANSNEGSHRLALTLAGKGMLVSSNRILQLGSDLVRFASRLR